MTKRKLYLIIIGILLLVSIAIGVSYSIYVSEVVPIDQTMTHIKTKEMNLTLIGENEINAPSMVPGNSFEKTFKVENKSNTKVKYNIYMTNILNEFDEDLVYTLTDDEGTVVSEKKLPFTTSSGKKYLKTDIEIDPEATVKNYTLTIEFKYSDTKDQSSLMGARFHATLGIDAEQVDTAICKRAETLLSQKCSSSGSSYGCQNVGYVINESVYFGNDPSTRQSGVLVAGDAFDCDVNGNNIIDTDSNGNSIERFYYISDYYDTETTEFDEDTAVLLYFTSTEKSNTNELKLYHGTSSGYIAYDANGYSYKGPVTTITNLPTTEQWSNVSLKKTKRKILTNLGGTQITKSGTTYDLPGSGTNPLFDYTGYAARLLTVQELSQVITEEGVTVYTRGVLDSHQYLLGTTSFMSKYSGNYWLENVNSYDSGMEIESSIRYVSTMGVDNSSYMTTRPVIEVDKANIRY